MTIRLRITFSKTGSLRYTGHLDLQTLWERTARRAALSLAYSHGFHPGPKIQIASALPLGYAGCAEIVDMWLETDPGDLSDARKRLQAGSPPGLTILSLDVVDDHGPALQTQVASAEYAVTLLEPGSGSDLPRGVQALLGAESLPRERRGKPYDLRPLVETLELLPADPDGMRHIRMTLAAREGATGRPEEVLDVLGIPLESAHPTHPPDP